MGKFLDKFLILFILISAFVITYSHQGDLLFDCGREAYYPTQVLLGKILYKDIFNIYGPFSYMFNAFLYKLFGISLNTLYIAGFFTASLLVSVIYKISKMFFSKFISIAIVIFTVSIGFLNNNLFNYIFPYSYAMLYGICGVVTSIYFLLKFQLSPTKSYLLYISCFFAGISIASKYEFLPFVLVILYILLKNKNSLNFKNIYYSLFCLIFVPVFCFGILFLQGLDIIDLQKNIKIIASMMHSQTLKYFYISQGVYFNSRTLPTLAISFIKTALILAIFFSSFRIKNNILKYFCILVSSIILFLSTSTMSFIFLPIFLIIAFAFKFNDTTITEKILFISVYLISLKIIFGLATLNYGVYYYPLYLILGIIFLKKSIAINERKIAICLLIISLSFATSNIFQQKKFLLKTPLGQIYTTKAYQKSTQQLFEYISKNTKKTDKIVILPEGLLINFLSNRNSDNFYNSMIPLYVEATGEKTFISHYKLFPPNYIIFNSANMSKDYYFNNICNDYAFEFCNFVHENYILKKTIDNEFRYLIFSLK